MKRVAFLIKGGVSRRSGSTLATGTLYDNSPYVNYHATKRSIEQHIIAANPRYRFDFFLHGWNTDLEEQLVDLYQPKKSLFEDNNQYREIITKKIQTTDTASFRQASQFLSLRRGCSLIDSTYDLIIVYRFDLLLWKDINLDNYDPDALTVNNYEDCRGDFHIVTGFQNLLHLSLIYESIGSSNPPIGHEIIRTYARRITGIGIQVDDIVAGDNQEVTRKLRAIYEQGRIQSPILEKFGLTVDDILSYTVE